MDKVIKINLTNAELSLSAALERLRLEPEARERETRLVMTALHKVREALYQPEPPSI